MHRHQHQRGGPPGPFHGCFLQDSTPQSHHQQQQHRSDDQQHHRKAMADRQLQGEIVGMAMPTLSRIDRVQHTESSSPPAQPRTGGNQLQGIPPLPQTGVFPGGGPSPFQESIKDRLGHQCHRQLAPSGRDTGEHHQQQRRGQEQQQGEQPKPLHRPHHKGNRQGQRSHGIARLGEHNRNNR